MIESKPVFDDSDSDPSIAILAEFLELWEGAPQQDREGILQAHCGKHPELADQFHGLVAGWRVVSDAKDPERLGPYRIIHVLAIGGMGKVYEAEDEVLSRRVAVKTIRHGRSADPKLLERFTHEREALALLHHTNIVPIYGAGEEAGLLYFAMPLLEGFTLADLVRASCRMSSASASTGSPSTWEELLSRATTEATRERYCRRVVASLGHSASMVPNAESPPSPAQSSGPPSPLGLPRDYRRHVVEVIAVAAEAIHSAHEAKVLHRDLKPSNIQIEPSRGTSQPTSHPWVLDFGLAHFQGSKVQNDGPEKAAPDDPTRPSPTNRPTEGIGTPGYMAPEQVPRAAAGVNGMRAEDRPPIGRYTDVWSLGVTLYELLTLHMPFRGQNVAEVLRKIVSEPPERCTGSVPRELEATCLKALEKDPSRRYESAASFAADLRRWLEVRPTLAGEVAIRHKAGRVLGGPWVGARRLGFWSRRRPAAAFAAGLLTALLVVGIVGAKAQLEAKQRELDLITLARLRAPIRTRGWFEKAWAKARELVADRPDKDGLFQGECTTLLDGLDVRLAKSFEKDANIQAFDPKGKRLLMGRPRRGPDGGIVTRVVTGYLEGQQGPTEMTFPTFGVVGFRDGEPLFVGLDGANPSTIRVRDAITGGEKSLLKSPLNGPSMTIAHMLSRDGTRCAGIVWPITEGKQEAKDKADPNNRPKRNGDTATLVVWDVATGGVVRTIEQKQASNHDVALSPDGSLLVTWAVDGPQHDAVVWAVNEGTLIGRFPSTRSMITSVAFGRDPVWREDAKGSQWRLAVGEHGGMITVWDLHSQAVKSIALGSHNDVKTLDFSSDGAWLASAGRDDVMIWNPSSGECLLRVPSEYYQLAVAFSPDNRRLSVAKSPAFGDPGGVDVYDLDIGRGRRTLRGLQQRIEKVVVSLDGRRIAALSNDWEVGVFEMSSGALIGIAEAPEGFFTDNASLALSADGSRLVCSAGTEAKLWDVDKGRFLRKWKLSPALTEAVAFRPGGRVILIRQETKGGVVGPFSGADPREHPRVCRAYELPEQGNPKKTVEITDFNWYVENISVTADGSYFAVQGTSTATGEPARIIHLYSGLTGNLVGSIATTVPPNDWATAMRFDPKGTRLHVWRDVRDPHRCDIFEIPSLKVMGMATDANTANVGVSRWVSLLPQSPNAPEMLLLREQGRPSPLLRIVRDVWVSGSDGIKFSPDGNHIVWGNQDGTVTVCDLDEVQRRLAGVGLGWQ